MKEKSINSGIIQMIDTELYGNTAFQPLRTLFSEFLTKLYVPFFDKCCPDETTILPTGYDKDLEIKVYYNPETESWEPLPNTGGGDSSFTSYEIEEEVNSIEGTELGLTSGSFVFAHPDLEGRNVVVHRNLQKLPSKPWSTNTYYTKNLEQNFITFSNPLEDEELISILIL